MPPSSKESKTSAAGHWLSRGVFGIGLASLCSDWGHEIGTALLPILLAGLGAPAYALGVIEGVADGLSSFAKLAGGWIADRPALRKPVAVTGYLLTGLSTFAFGFVGSWPQVLASRAMGWMGRGARGPSRDVLLTDSVAPGQVGRAFGFERTMDTVGAILGPLCATALVAVTSIRIAMRWTILPGALAALAFATLVPPSSRDREHHALPFTASISRLPQGFRQFLKAVALFGLGDFAHTLLILRAVQLLSPSYGLARAGGIAVALYTFHNIIYATACYPAGSIGDRIGRRRVLIVGYLAAAAMSIGFILAPPRLPELFGLFGVAGLYVAIQDTLEKSVAAELLPREVRAAGYGVLATVNGIGDFFSSIVVGFLWTALSPTAGFAYAAVFTAMGGVWLFFTGQNSPKEQLATR
jgi:MFS family permease